MRTIVMKFAGPLQSWGTSSHFETRHTDYYPSKSAVIGLISACLGYERTDDVYISQLNDLDFAVRVDQKGNLLRDYHTAKKYKNNGSFERTYVTNRYYLEDAIFLVGISSQKDDLMLKIEKALQNPYYQPFMGRRSLPLNSDFFYGSYEEQIINCLKKINWQASQWYKKRYSNKLTIYADSHLLDRKISRPRKDRVVSFSQQERRFGYRYESLEEIVVIKESNQTNHNVFDELGG